MLDYAKVYDSYQINLLLSEAVKYKSLTSPYLSRVLDEFLPQDEMVLSTKLDLYLYFIEGILVDYSSADGLIPYARDWKRHRPDVFDLYFKEAMKYWQNDLSKAIKEVNNQVDAQANIPRANTNEYILLHQI